MLKKSETKNSLKTLKFRNRKLVLQFMRNSGSVSVNEISRATGLSKMTVHKIIDHYLEEAMISHAGKGVSTEEGGKKPNLFAFNADCRYIFAVRLGGDFLSTSIVNLKGETIVERNRVSLAHATFDQVVKMIGDAFIDQVAAKDLPKENCLATVVGCNGVVDAEKGVCLASYQYPDWGVNMPVRECLEALLPDNVPVHVDSWWRHLAHGEVHFGQHSDGKNFFLIGNSGDYLSGGMVMEGQACRGASGFAGEIGHMIVAPESTVQCVCGGYGCLEALVAPGRVVEKAKAQFSAFPNSRIFAGSPTGEVAGFRALCEAANQGDELACKLFDEVAFHFSIAINNIVHICDPGRIVFFGDYAKCGDYFMQALKKRAGHLSMNGIDKRTELAISALGDDQGVVGAANHMTDKLFAGK